MFKSTDGEGSWSAVIAGLPAGAVNALAIDPLTPTTLYAGTGSSGVFKTDSSDLCVRPVLMRLSRAPSVKVL